MQPPEDQATSQQQHQRHCREACGKSEQQSFLQGLGACELQSTQESHDHKEELAHQRREHFDHHAGNGLRGPYVTPVMSIIIVVRDLRLRRSKALAPRD
jgi:hypothetical protein